MDKHSTHNTHTDVDRLFVFMYYQCVCVFDIELKKSEERDVDYMYVWINRTNVVIREFVEVRLHTSSLFVSQSDIRQAHKYRNHLSLSLQFYAGPDA